MYGVLDTPGARRTVMIYAHYDGQKVDPGQWATPPWSPTLRDAPLEQGGKTVPENAWPQTIPGTWWLYARSAGDDKTPIQAVLSALDALKASGENQP